MKIRMKTLACGPAGNFQPGKEYEVADKVGQPMVEGGYAEDLTVPEAPEATPPPQPEAPEATGKKNRPRPTERKGKL